MTRKEKIQKSKQDALIEYERKQAEIEKLLKQIKVGIEKHDRDASIKGGHHWGHVGDLGYIVEELAEIRDRLHGLGEYAG